ncbi:hypothetical protein C4J81_16650 [Deltaproteobacteria bacterium Smac51]|nr:hypothetical protein C4J81_16650 [Deltaproteobacteria bacterium Smac51]
MTPEQKKYLHYEILGNSYPLPLIMPSSKTKEYILIEATILFAQKGYAAVSMRELADVIGIKPASLYNHFGSKEALWEAVVEHAKGLYYLYFRKLDETLSQADTFRAVLNIIFMEPEKMSNIFTCYAFGLIQAEQFRDERCAEIFNGTFLDYSINFIKRWFDRSVEQKRVEPFDTYNTALIIMHGVLNGLALKVQETMGRRVPHGAGEMMTGLKHFILSTVTVPDK